MGRFLTLRSRWSMQRSTRPSSSSGRNQGTPPGGICPGLRGPTQARMTSDGFFREVPIPPPSGSSSRIVGAAVAGGWSLHHGQIHVDQQGPLLKKIETSVVGEAGDPGRRLTRAQTPSTRAVPIPDCSEGGEVGRAVADGQRHLVESGKDRRQPPGQSGGFETPRSNHQFHRVVFQPPHFGLRSQPEPPGRPPWRRSPPPTGKARLSVVVAWTPTRSDSHAQGTGDVSRAWRPRGADVRGFAASRCPGHSRSRIPLRGRFRPPAPGVSTNRPPPAASVSGILPRCPPPRRPPTKRRRSRVEGHPRRSGRAGPSRWGISTPPKRLRPSTRRWTSKP